MAKIFLILLALITSHAFCMPVGFNQAWFHNNYGTQYLDQDYDEAEVERIFKITHDAGSTNLRLWFFESAYFPMLEWQGDKIVSIRADFIKNVIRTLQIAKKNKVKVYMTFLDAHAYRPDKLTPHLLKRLKSVYREREFLENAIGPFLKAIENAGIADSIGSIDLVNEVDTVVNRLGFNHRWDGASKMLCQWRSFIKNFESFKDTPVTFSLRLHPLLTLPKKILSDDGPLSCADFLDFHSYSNKGKIHRCNSFKKYSLLNKKKLVLGEFGQSFFNHRYDDNLHQLNTSNYLEQAKSCGFSEALAWRLSDVRPGKNKEARYSFEAYGVPRPAYHIIQRYNQQ